MQYSLPYNLILTNCVRNCVENKQYKRSDDCIHVLCCCLFKRLLQTRGPYKITSNIKKKHCVNTINITEK